MSNESPRVLALSALIAKNIAPLVRDELRDALSEVPTIIEEIEDGHCRRLGLRDSDAAGILLWYYRSGWSRLRSCAIVAAEAA